MTYRYFIRKNNMPDTEDSFRKYCEQYHSQWDHMNEGMRDQYIAVNYKFRFIDHAWC